MDTNTSPNPVAREARARRNRRPSRAALPGVQLNRHHGIFQLSLSFPNPDSPKFDVHRRQIIIAPSADVARVQAAEYGRETRTGRDERWMGPETEVVCIGLAEKSQPLGLVAKSGEW